MVPVEILAQAKPKEPPSDALPKFIELYTSQKRVGSLLKETHTGKLVGEWDKRLAEATDKPELVEIFQVISTFMAQKDEEELVRAFVTSHLFIRLSLYAESNGSRWRININIAQTSCCAQARDDPG